MVTGVALTLGATALVVALAALVGVIRQAWRDEQVRRERYEMPNQLRGPSRLDPVPEAVEQARREVLLAARILRDKMGDAEPGPSHDLHDEIIGVCETVDRLREVTR